jgi:hypothetical protein
MRCLPSGSEHGPPRTHRAPSQRQPRAAGEAENRNVPGSRSRLGPGRMASRAQIVCPPVGARRWPGPARRACPFGLETCGQPDPRLRDGESVPSEGRRVCPVWEEHEEPVPQYAPRRGSPAALRSSAGVVRSGGLLSRERHQGGSRRELRSGRGRGFRVVQIACPPVWATRRPGSDQQPVPLSIAPVRGRRVPPTGGQAVWAPSFPVPIRLRGLHQIPVPQYGLSPSTVQRQRRCGVKPRVGRPLGRANPGGWSHLHVFNLE